MRVPCIALCALLTVASPLFADEATHAGKTGSAWAGLLASKNVVERQHAIEALRALGGGSGEVLAAVGRALGDGDEKVRSTAYATLLSRVDGGGPVLGDVKEMLTQPIPTDPEQRYVYLFVLQREPAAALRHPNGGVRKAALEVCLWVPSLMRAELFKLVLGRALKRYEPRTKVRELAIALLREIYLWPVRHEPYMEAHRKTVAQLLLVAATDEAIEIRKGAMEALGAVANGQSVTFARALLAALMKGTRDPSKEVRGAALQGFGLADHECPEAAGAFLAALQDEELVHDAALNLKIVGDLAEPTTALLHSMIAAKSGSELGSVIVGLGRLGERAAPFVPPLLTLFREARKARGQRSFRNSEVAWLLDGIVQTFGRIGPKASAALPEIEAVFTSREAKGGVYAYAMLRLGTKEESAALAHLVAVAVGVDLDVLRAQRWLGWLGSAAAPALPLLLEHLRTGTLGEKSRIADTLGAMGEIAAGATRTLRELLEKHKDSRHAFTERARAALAAIQPAPR